MGFSLRNISLDFNQSKIAAMIAINVRMDFFNTFNTYMSISLIIFGYIGNMISLAVFCRARHMPPKISGSRNAIALVITNTVYLLIHGYNLTLNRIIYQFNLDASTSLLASIFPPKKIYSAKKNWGSTLPE
jgi:hypothetical protein